MKNRTTLLIAFAIFFICACSKENRTEPDVYDHVMICYAGGYNNLSGSISRNIDNLCAGEVPDRYSGNVIVLLAHNTLNNREDFYNVNAPCLIRLYREDGKVVRDTVKVYPERAVDSDANFFGSVLSEVRDKYKAEHYGLVYSSHATGWLPENYAVSPEAYEKSKDTKSIGCQFGNDTPKNPGNVLTRQEMDVKDFAKAIPMHLDYIIFDCCLMSCVETVYQLRTKCDYIVASPTEVLSTGFIYETMAAKLFRYPQDLRGVCEDYYNFYKSYASEPSATVALMDCSKAELLAETTRKIISQHKDNFNRVSRSFVQKYYRPELSENMRYFYDFRHIIELLEPTEKELATFDSMLDQFVLYKAATDWFMTIKIMKFSGLSMFIPDTDCPKLNAYYNTLDWDKDVDYIASWKN